MNIYDLAYQTWNDLDEPSTVNPSFISGWMVNAANVGKLNNLISTNYTGVNGTISPEIGQEEAAIYSEMYQSLYYKQRINENLGAGGVQWVELENGDSRVRRASPTEVAKVYKDLLRECNANLKDLITNYKYNLSFPRTNNFANA